MTIFVLGRKPPSFMVESSSTTMGFCQLFLYLISLRSFGFKMIRGTMRNLSMQRKFGVFLFEASTFTSIDEHLQCGLIYVGIVGHLKLKNVLWLGEFPLGCNLLMVHQSNNPQAFVGGLLPCMESSLNETIPQCLCLWDIKEYP